MNEAWEHAVTGLAFKDNIAHVTVLLSDGNEVTIHYQMTKEDRQVLEASAQYFFGRAITTVGDFTKGPD